MPIYWGSKAQIEINVHRGTQVGLGATSGLRRTLFYIAMIKISVSSLLASIKIAVLFELPSSAFKLHQILSIV